MKVYRLDGTRSSGWAEAPEDVDLIAELGGDWRMATTRERIWRYLTVPRFSWITFTFISIVGAFIRVVLFP
jgi:hypothetical protein